MVYGGSAARAAAAAAPEAPGKERAGSGQAESRLAARFGQDLLGAGYTVTPNLLLRHAAQLGISNGELLLIQYIWQYWWGEQKPHPSVPALAQQMGKSQRMVRYYLQALRDKGLLFLEERRGRTGERVSNGFDFAPLFHAVRRLAEHDRACSALQGGPADDCLPSLQRLAADQDRDYPEINPRGDLDRSMGRQTEASGRAETTANDRPAYLSRTVAPAPHPPATPLAVPGTPPPAPCPASLPGLIAAIGRGFGDEAHPRVSARRAENLLQRSAMAPEDFLEAVEEARTITLAHAAAVTRRRQPAHGAAGRKNLMPYFFATLEGMLEPGEEEEAELVRAVAGPGQHTRCDSRPQAPDQDAAEVGTLWHAVLAELRGVLAPEAFNRWLAPTRVLRVDAATLEIGVRDAMHRHWLEVRLQARIAEALAATGAQVQIRYRLVGQGEDGGADR